MLLTHHAKATFVALAAIGALVAGLMTYLHGQHWRSARSAAASELIDQEAALLRSLQRLDRDELKREIEELNRVSPSPRNSNEVIALLTPDYVTLAGPAIAPLDSSEGAPLYRITLADGSELEAFGLTRPVNDEQVLFIGRLTAPYATRLRQTWAALIGGGLTAALPLLILTVWTHRRVTREIDLFAAVCRSVGEGHLDRRVPRPRASDEMAALAVQVNGMIARLQRLVASLNDLGDSVRHEVAHGVTRIDMKTRRLRELIASGTGGARDDAAELLDEIQTECRSIVASSEAMLSLSQIKAGEGFNPTRTDLAQVAADVVAALEVLAEEKSIAIESELAPAAVLGDARLLAVMISNLVSNAIKYSPDAGRVTVRVGSADGHGEIDVCDTGPGIRPEDREDVFVARRRLERDSAAPGHGYGLAITRAIAERHGGSIEIVDSEAGAHVRVRLPSFDAGRRLQPGSESR